MVSRAARWLDALRKTSCEKARIHHVALLPNVGDMIINRTFDQWINGKYISDEARRISPHGQRYRSAAFMVISKSLFSDSHPLSKNSFINEQTWKACLDMQTSGPDWR